jgi:hypothetical protein
MKKDKSGRSMIDGKTKYRNCRIKKNNAQYKYVDLQARAVLHLSTSVLNEDYNNNPVIAENEISTNLYFLWKIR